jgi:two-component system, response regulator YesN
MKIVRENSYFIRLAVSFLALATLALLISSFIVYENFEVATLKENKTISEQMLSQTVYGADLIWDWASMHAIEVYKNGYVFSAVYDATVTPIDEMMAQEVLASAMSSNPYIYSIYLYNGSADRIFSTVSVGYAPQDFFDQDIVRILKDPSEYRQYRFIPRRLDFTHYDKTYAEDVISLIVAESPASGGTVNGALVLNIKASAMRNLMESYIPAADTLFIILDAGGRVVCHTDPGMFRRDLSREPFASRVEASPGRSGFFTDSFNGKDHLITYAKSDKLKWSFIRLKPYAALLEKTYSVRNLIVILLLSAFILILVISLWLSWRFSRPYTRVVESSNVLRRKYDEGRNFLRREYLKNLLAGGSPPTDDVELKFGELDIRLRTDRLAVLLFRIDDYRRGFALPGREREAQELKGVMEARSHALISAVYPCQTVDMGPDEVAVVYNPEDGVEDAGVGRMAEAISQVQKAARELCGAGVAAAVGPVVTDAAELPAAYHGALDVSEYRLVYGCGQVMTEDMVRARINADYAYSDEAEAGIVESLKMRNYAAAEAGTNALFKDIAGATYDDMLMSVDRLAYASLKAIALMTGRKKQAVSYKSTKSALELMSSLDEMRAWFLGFFRDFIEDEADGTEDVTRKHVDRVVEIVASEYGNPNLSSDWLAERLGLSSSYLRGIFRDRMGIPLSGYISDLRCRNAAPLLLETTLSIQEICARIGLSNANYFFTLFKKHRGMTPTQFRTKGREESST